VVVGMLIVVRHAVAVDRADWTGDDLLRPLTPLGREQAEGLVARLEDHPIERILSSPSLRCTQTVEPLARRRLVPVEPFAPLGVDVPAAEPSPGDGGRPVLGDPVGGVGRDA
jgi:broad specificity phosphatase PhoE